MFGVDPVALIAGGGLFVICIIVFLEIAFLPFFIFPGDSLLFAGGYLASQGHFNIMLLVVFVTISTFIGGLVSYYVGTKLGIIFTEKPPHFIKPSYIEKTNAFYVKYGAKTILIMRFIPIVRTLAPLFAGIGFMRKKLFIIYNIIGSFLWASVFLFLGYFFGQFVPNLDHYISIALFIVVGLSIVIMFFSIFKYRSK